MLKLSLDALSTLDAIARRGSFAAAAAELHRVPSALTYTMAKLEDDLGVKLFDRSGRKAVLTAAGRELLDEGRHLLSLAGELECRVQQVAKGWEVELRIVVDVSLAAEGLLPLIARFDREGSGTRIRITYEVLGGTWDALLSRRADLAVGAGGEPLVQAGVAVRRMEAVAFLFAVAPAHPLARAQEPIPPAELQRHRAVAVGDTSRHLPARSTGLLLGQDTLTVPDFNAKVAAQRAGLGVGYLPEPIAREEQRAGRLLIKRVAEPKLEMFQYLAWRTANKGRALAWFLERLDTKTCAALTRRKAG
ncbi:MAG: LysR family transcriptional regulator [Betaproteobacteria bacterium]|nr:LysR family transcriptional regulator [Betaproteobacteria bacterium]